MIQSSSKINYKKPKTIANHGCLGNRNDEGRSEMRYVVWIAEFSESSNPWTHMALPGIPGSMPVWVSVTPIRHMPACFACGVRAWKWSVPVFWLGRLECRCVCLFELAAKRSPVWYRWYAIPLCSKMCFLCGKSERCIKSERERADSFCFSSFSPQISDQVKRPGEFKHITNRRKRN